MLTLKLKEEGKNVQNIILFYFKMCKMLHEKYIFTITKKVRNEVRGPRQLWHPQNILKTEWTRDMNTNLNGFLECKAGRW